MPKLYAANQEAKPISQMEPASAFSQQEEGNPIMLPTQLRNFDIPKEGTTVILDHSHQFAPELYDDHVSLGEVNIVDCSKQPVSVFSTALETCGSFIYIYPRKESSVSVKEGMPDHIVIHHALSSAVSKDELPTADEFNFNHHPAKTIQVIIGTINPYDKGMQQSIKFLTDNGVPEENIFVYLKCKNSFGVDSSGNIGERGESFRTYANKMLAAFFVNLIKKSLQDYLTQPIFEHKDSVGFFSKHSKKDGSTRAGELMKKLEDKFSNGFDTLIEYLEKGPGKLKPESLKTMVMKNLAEAVQGLELGIQLPTPMTVESSKLLLQTLQNKIYRQAIPLNAPQFQVVAPVTENKIEPF